MKTMNYKHYQSKPTLELPDRSWPDQKLERAPQWASVDLRDGNQSLEIPMSLEQKAFFFQYLVELGFKQIEIGFPSSAPTEFNFARKLIEDRLIPNDVAIQVLTQSREDLIDTTFRAVAGAPRAIIHLYNSISELHREVVFQKSHEEIVELAVKGAQLMAKRADEDTSGTEFIMQYSPENFSQSDMDFAVQICDAVTETWLDAGYEDIIINLPATVECSLPNVYADQIEYFSQHSRYRDRVTLSLHTHNDRGTAVAACELGLLAGADRIEGTLFGNGERTGNVDILTIAMNLFSQGIDPKLDFSDIDRTVEVYELSTGMEVSQRHPYAGDLVYTAFSGSHQDAIRKGMAQRAHLEHWDIPYLPIDPADVGRSYEPLIRINAQSGKGGVAYVMEQRYGYQLPKVFQRALSHRVTEWSDRDKLELTPEMIFELYQETYQNLTSPYKLLQWSEQMESDTQVSASAVLWESPVGTDTSRVTLGSQGEVVAHGVTGQAIQLDGSGHGLLESVSSALSRHLNRELNISMYHQHALEQTAASKAITYIGLTSGSQIAYGTGMSGNITKSSLRALVSAVNRLLMDEQAS